MADEFVKLPVSTEPLHEAWFKYDPDAPEGSYGLKESGPFTITGQWQPPNFVATWPDGLPRKTKKAVRKWVSGSRLGRRERQRVAHAVSYLQIDYARP